MTEQVVGKAIIRAEVDGAGIESGVADAKRSLAGLGQAGAAAGKEASTGLAGIGAAAEQSAGKIDASTKRLVADLQRAIATTAAASKGTAEYYQSLASQRGANLQVLAPYLRQLEEVQAKTRAAAEANQRLGESQAFLASLSTRVNTIGKSAADLAQLRAAQLGVAEQAAPLIARLREQEAGLGRVGVQAAATALQLRQVAPQMTDIVTSLAAGQAPLQVLIQQGGQLKDVFGGVGPAARALGGYVLSLVNPFTVAAAAAAVLFTAIYQGAAQTAEFNKAVILSGNAAGGTVSQYRAMAVELAKVGGTQGAALQAIQAFVETGRVGAEQIQRFAAVAQQLDRLAGKPIADTVKEFASLGEAPVEASVRLTEKYNFLTAAVYAQIKALKEQGRDTEAARVAQEAFASALETRLAPLAANLGTLERGWNAITGAAKGAWDAMLGVGRAGTITEQLAEVGERVRRQSIGAGSSRLPLTGAQQAKLDADLQLQANLQEMARLERRGAESAAARAKESAAAAAWDKETAKYKSDQVKLEQEIARIRQAGVEAGRTEKEINDAILAARAAAAKAPSAAGRKVSDPFYADAARAYADVIADLGRIELDAAAKTEGLSKAQARLREIMASPAWATYGRQAQEQVITAAARAQAAEDLQAAELRAAAAVKESTKAYLQNLQAQERVTEGVAAQVLKLQDEEQAAALAAQQNITLAQAVELVTIARLQERQVAALGNEDLVLALQREIDKRRELAELIARKAGRDEGARAGKEAAQEQLRTLQATDDVARQVFANIASEGDGAFKSIGRSIKANVVDLLYRLTLRPLVIQFMGGASGASGSVIQQAIGATNPLGSIANALGLGSLGTTVGAASYAALVPGLSSIGAGSQAAMLAAQTADFGLAGLSATASAGGAGTLASMLGPIGAGVALLALLSKSFKGGETRAGGQYNFGDLISGPSGGEIGGGGVAARMAQVAADSINSTLAKVGSSQRLTNFFSGLESSKNGKGFAYAGGTLGGPAGALGPAFGQGWGAAFAQDGWNNRRGDLTPEQAMEAFQEELLQATLQALQAATDVPEAIASLLRDKNFDELGKTELEALLAQVNATITDFDRFRVAAAQLPFERLSGLSLDLATALARAAGGMDNLLAAAGSFYSADFFSAAELRQQTARNIERTLSAAGGTFSVQQILGAADQGQAGRQMFRQVVEAFEQRVAGGEEAAAPFLAALYSVASAFASITPVAEEAAQTLVDGFKSAAEARADYLRDLGGAGEGIASLIRDLVTTRAGLASPGELLANTRAAYLGDLGAARSGDVAASQRIADSARAYINAQKGFTASGPQTSAVIAQVVAELQSLPAVQTYEQQMLEQGRQQAQLLADIRANTSATVGAVASGFQGLAGFVPSAPANVGAPAGGAAWGGTPTQQASAAVGGAAWGGTATAAQSFEQVLRTIDWADGAAGRAAMVQAMQLFNKTAADVSAVYSWFTAQEIADDLKRNGYGYVVPGYAAGGLHAGGVRLVGERGSELEVTGPARYWSFDQTRQMLQGDNMGGEAVYVLRALMRMSQRVDEGVRTLVEVTSAFARANVAQGAQIVDNTAASKTAALLEANKPTPVRSGAA